MGVAAVDAVGVLVRNGPAQEACLARVPTDSCATEILMVRCRETAEGAEPECPCDGLGSA